MERTADDKSSTPPVSNEGVGTRRDTTRAKRWAGRLHWLLVLGIFVVSVTFWSPFSDGRMAVIDPVKYAQGVEAAESLTNDPELGATNANHILYHFALFGLTRGFDALGLPHPGHHATQVLSGFGTALTVLVLTIMAGPRRRWIGLLCGVVLASMRGSFYHACGGETVPLATALSIWTLHLASRDRPRLVWVSVAMALAFLARQDSVFIVPAVFVLLVGRVRFWPMFTAFAIAGAVPIVTWYLAWAGNDAINHIATFKDFVLGIGNHGTFSFAEIVELPPPYLLTVAFHNAFFPQFDPLDQVPVAYGLIPVGVLAFAAFALRGRSAGRNHRLLLAFLTLLLVRESFFLWFEPQNWEWQVPVVAMGLGLLARSTRGDAVFRGRVRDVSLVLMGLLAAWVFVVHAPSSYRARREVLSDAVDHAIGTAGRDTRYISLGFKPYRLAEWRGCDSLNLDDEHPFTSIPANWEPVAAAVLPWARAQGRDIVLMVDVFVRNGQPYTRRILDEVVNLDSAPGVVESDELTFLWYEGRLFGLYAHPRR